MRDINRMIASAIVSAQIASDAGKGLHELQTKNSVGRTPNHYRYRCKTAYIMEAIKLIRSNKTEFNYYMSDIEGDQNGYPSVIAYFDFKVCGKRYQISFHTPLNQMTAEMRELCGTGRKTRWRKNHESSRDACEVLIKEYQLVGSGGSSNKKHHYSAPAGRRRPYGNARERK